MPPHNLCLLNIVDLVWLGPAVLHFYWWGGGHVWYCNIAADKGAAATWLVSVAPTTF